MQVLLWGAISALVCGAGAAVVAWQRGVPIDRRVQIAMVAALVGGVGVATVVELSHLPPPP